MTALDRKTPLEMQMYPERKGVAEAVRRLVGARPLDLPTNEGEPARLAPR